MSGLNAGNVELLIAAFGAIGKLRQTIAAVKAKDPEAYEHVSTHHADALKAAEAASAEPAAPTG